MKNPRPKDQLETKIKQLKQLIQQQENTGLDQEEAKSQLRKLMRSKETKVHDVYAVGTDQGVVPVQGTDGSNQEMVREGSTNEDIGRDQQEVLREPRGIWFKKS